jgi:hypothetical protein
MTLEANVLKLYIDGVVQVTVTVSISSGAVSRSTAYIGRNNWGSSYDANAYFDDVKIFNRSLTSFEVQRVMNSYN